MERAQRRLAKAVRQQAHGITGHPDPPDLDSPHDPAWGRYPRLLGPHPMPDATRDDVLDHVLPCGRDDNRRLLLDIPGVGPFDAVFGDLGHLEIWVRDSDLANGRTADCWAMVTS